MAFDAPPIPPGAGPAQPFGGGAMGAPSLMQLAGMGNSPGQTPTAGMSQISESAVRMGAEIDQALKLLAQAIPAVAPWVEKVVMELRYQIGTALQAGAVPQSPVPADNERFPDGGANL